MRLLLSPTTRLLLVMVLCYLALLPVSHTHSPSWGQLGLSLLLFTAALALSMWTRLRTFFARK